MVRPAAMIEFSAAFQTPSMPQEREHGLERGLAGPELFGHLQNSGAAAEGAEPDQVDRQQHPDAERPHARDVDGAARHGMAPLMPAPPATRRTRR